MSQYKHGLCPVLGLQLEGWLKVFRFFRFKFLRFRFRGVVENFMDIFNNLERVGTVQMRHQKHYENDTDE